MSKCELEGFCKHSESCDKNELFKRHRCPIYSKFIDFVNSLIESKLKEKK